MCELYYPFLFFWHLVIRKDTNNIRPAIGKRYFVIRLDSQARLYFFIVGIVRIFSYLKFLILINIVLNRGKVKRFWKKYYLFLGRIFSCFTFASRLLHTGRYNYKNINGIEPFGSMALFRSGPPNKAQ